jgi:cytochrome c-type biogenesis protein CcsB
MNSSTLFGISTVTYILAMMLYITYIAFRNSPLGMTATAVTVTGFAAQTAAILIRWSEAYSQWVIFSPESTFIISILRSAPLKNLYESLVFFVWCLMLGYLIIEFIYKNRSFGAFATPVAGVALAFINLSGISSEIEPLMPALQSNWLLVHVMMSFIAYATFALSFSTGLMYLILKTEKRNEPSYIFWTTTLGIFISIMLFMGIDFFTFKVMVRPDQFIKSYLFKTSLLNQSLSIKLISWFIVSAIIAMVWWSGLLLKRIIEKFSIPADILDEITYKSIAIGFPIFTLGGLIFGAIWANQAWGTYWSWDPKETWSLITWFVYAFYLHSRTIRGWRGKKVAIVAVVGFGVVMFTYLGVNLLLSGLHSYGEMR